jgi:hypothetical protein
VPEAATAGELAEEVSADETRSQSNSHSLGDSWLRGPVYGGPAQDKNQRQE